MIKVSLFVNQQNEAVNLGELELVIKFREAITLLLIE